MSRTTYNLVPMESLSLPDFVEADYREILDPESDPGGKAHRAGLLKSYPRENVVIYPVPYKAFLVIQFAQVIFFRDV